MMLRRLAGFVVLVLLAASIFPYRLAFFKDPYTDLSLHPTSIYPSERQALLWVYSPERGTSCARAFQGIFNEMVRVDEHSVGDEVKVTFFNHGHYDAQKQTLSSTYWAPQASLVFLDEIGGDPFAVVPIPLLREEIDDPSFTESALRPTVTLVEPWFDEKTKRTYSAGTRFIKIAGSLTHDELIEVALFDVDAHQAITSFVPRKLCIDLSQASFDERRKAFVHLLCQWARPCYGTDGSAQHIPYVWGGMSYVGTEPVDNFFLERAMTGKTFWNRRSALEYPAGMCCSTLVLRAAQICLLPYYFSTTWTAAAFLRAMRADEHIEPGDILWLAYRDGPWAHLQVLVGPFQEGPEAGQDALVEAAGYSSDFGYVGMISLSRRFDGVESYRDLEELFLSGGELRLWSSDHTELYPMKDFKILKLSSLRE